MPDISPTRPEISRRTLTRGATTLAWVAPAVTLAAPAPAFATSTTGPLYPSGQLGSNRNVPGADGFNLIVRLTPAAGATLPAGTVFAVTLPKDSARVGASGVGAISQFDGLFPGWSTSATAQSDGSLVVTLSPGAAQTPAPALEFLIYLGYQPPVDASRVATVTVTVPGKPTETVATTWFQADPNAPSISGG